MWSGAGEARVDHAAHHQGRGVHPDEGEAAGTRRSSPTTDRSSAPPTRPAWCSCRKAPRPDAGPQRDDGRGTDRADRDGCTASLRDLRRRPKVGAGVVADNHGLAENCGTGAPQECGAPVAFAGDPGKWRWTTRISASGSKPTITACWTTARRRSSTRPSARVPGSRTDPAADAYRALYRQPLTVTGTCVPSS